MRVSAGSDEARALALGVRCTLGKVNPHVLQNVQHLSFRNAGKPVYKFVHGRATTKILKQRRNWYARVHEHPRSADALRSPLNGITIVPVNILNLQR